MFPMFIDCDLHLMIKSKTNAIFKIWIVCIVREGFIQLDLPLSHSIKQIIQCFTSCIIVDYVSSQGKCLLRN